MSQPSLQFQSEIFDTLSESVVKDSDYLVFNLEPISEYQDCKEVEQKSLVYMGCINQETGWKRTTIWFIVHLKQCNMSDASWSDLL